MQERLFKIKVLAQVTLFGVLAIIKINLSSWSILHHVSRGTLEPNYEDKGYFMFWSKIS